LSKLVVRPAGFSDLTSIEIIEKQGFLPCDVFSLRSLRRMIKNPKESIIIEVLEYDQEVVGYSVFLTRRGSRTVRLYSISILRQLSGRGYVWEYLQTRLKEFAGKGYLRAALEVRKENEAAIKLYGSLGFNVERTIEGYYADGADGYRMVKYLR